MNVQAKHTVRYLLVLVSVPALLACSSAIPTHSALKLESSSQVLGERVIANARLNADGKNSGLTPYQLVQAQFGSNAAESPDRFSGDHQGVAHIEEHSDPEIGPYFRFILHRDADGNKGKFIDRQRNEIKIYGGSPDKLKGYENSVFEYSWKFRISEQMQVTNKFTHIFQLKAVGGEDSMPIITLTGSTRNGKAGIEVRHSPLVKTNMLARNDWHLVQGQWLEAVVKAQYSDQGWFSLTLTRLSDGHQILNLHKRNLDMWRGNSSKHFVRPKWGIYRSTVEAHKLKLETHVDFANFQVKQFANK
ncbi:heparin lyase I family protein [Agarivorans sp. DSG3-1]|uniref:heparin lyase I family protein n=1 Tax=Agarivorans sp. DSG3-1 TaxID=3342249 RepID=UPI00398E5731